MTEAVNGWPMIDLVFLFCAIIGGLAFLIWVVLQFLGVDAESEVATDTDFNASEASGSSDVSFTLLSFQGLSAFLTMFGLVGLSAHREGNVSAMVSFILALLAGLVLSWAISRLFAMFSGFQSSGTLRIESAIGQEGTVYLTVPAGGEGKVELAVQGRLTVMPAVADKRQLIPTGKRVKVVGVNDGHTLVVTNLEL
ncbi:MAG: hypothetical protein AAGF92_07310 [Myxococcota bacterium]